MAPASAGVCTRVNDRKAVVAHFEANLSFGAMVGRLEEVYAGVLTERRA
jgi:hypothetical protein